MQLIVETESTEVAASLSRNDGDILCADKVLFSELTCHLGEVMKYIVTEYIVLKAGVSNK